MAKIICYGFGGTFRKWNDNDTERPKYLKKILSQGHFTQNKFQMD